MGICRTCQKDAGWLSHECADCRAKREAAEAARAAADREAAEQERQVRIDAMVEDALARLKTTTDAGGTVRLYDSALVNLAEGWVDARGLDQLRDLGERGWEVLMTSPHFQVNTSLDGSVSSLAFDTAQVLIGLTVTAANAAHLDGEIRTYYAVRAAEEIDARK